MSICLSTGLPHVGDACARCIRMDEIARRTREDPRAVAAQAVKEAVLLAKDVGRDLPLQEWLKLDDAWRSEVDEARAVFESVWAEKAEEYDRENKT